MFARILRSLCLLLSLNTGVVWAQCPAPPANGRTTVVYDLDDGVESWGTYCENAPLWAMQNVATPSLDGRSLQLSITGGASYSNAHFYRELTAEPAAVAFTLGLSFRFPSTTHNNEGSPSLVQALEFTMNKWDQGKRYEFALQWRNVGNGANPGWRYWDPHRLPDARWVDLGISDRLAGDEWHSLILQGEIDAGQVRYTRFKIDQRWHTLDLTIPPATTSGEPDRLAIAVQLDGNSTQSAYSVFVDQIYFARAFGIACGDGRIDRQVEDMTDPARWEAISDRGRATISLTSTAGCRGQALSVNYNLNGPYPAGAEWLVIVRRFDQSPDQLENFTNFSHLRIALKGSDTNAHHNVQIKVADANGRVNWFVSESIADLPGWRAIYVDLRSLECFGDPATTCKNPAPLDFSRVARIEIGIARCLRNIAGSVVECESGSDSNILSFDELAGVNLAPGGTHRLLTSARESVAANPAIRAKAAAALRDVQVRDGLAPAWYDEGIPNYNTYAQAVRILVLAMEYRLTGNETYRTALERAVNTMLSLQRGATATNAGAWFTAYEWNGTRFVPRDGCTGDESAINDVDRCFWVGNTAWMMIALDRARLALNGDPAALNHSLDRAAGWMIRKFGRLTDYPNVITYGLEGNISAYFGLLAARRTTEANTLGAAIFAHGWDSTEQRMKIGVLPIHFGTAADTAGSWGVHVLRSLGKESEARASQAYIASMYRIRSFESTRDGYGDVEGPWAPTVEFGAQLAAAGVKGANYIMNQIYAEQMADGLFRGSPDDFSGGSAWITRWRGIAPTGWAYFALAGDPLDVPRGTISEISTTNVAAGAIAYTTLTGTNLSGAAAVVVSGTGVTASIAEAGSGTSLPIILTVAPDAVQNARTITVITAAGTSELFAGLNVIPPSGLTPVINSLESNLPGLTPAVAALHGAAFTLTVNGSNFVSGAVASVGGVHLPTSLAGSEQLTIHVPPVALAAAGAIPVKVANPGGRVSNAVSLAVIERGDFNSTRTVNIGDALAMARNAGGVVRPPLPPSVGDINLSGSVNIGDALAIALFTGRVQTNMWTPLITSVSPSPALRNNTLVISGKHFSTTASDNQVLFTTTNGVARVVPSAATTTSLTVTVPADAVGGALQANRLDSALSGEVFGLRVSGTETPLFLAPVPATPVDVASSISLTGLGFSPTASNNTVLFKSANATIPGTVTAASETELTVTVPNGTVCGPITVAVSGKTSNARTLLVSGSPCALQLSDAWTAGGRGHLLVLEGAGFDVVNPARNLVRFHSVDGGRVTAPVVMAGATQLHVRVPGMAVDGLVTVSVDHVISNGLMVRGIAPPSLETVLANGEAQILAIEATGRLRAPLALYERIVSELGKIRAAYPNVANVFAMSSQSLNSLFVSFDESTFQSVRDRTYSAWNALNDRYGLVSVSLSQFARSAVLNLAGILNIGIVAPEYAALPGVTSAQPNGMIGDGNDVCLSISEQTHFYIFDAGSGDCPAGCINHKYWGFSVSQDGTITALGTWERSPSPEPAWFQSLTACRTHL